MPNRLLAARRLDWPVLKRFCEEFAVTVRVEFFGIPRQRAGTESIDVEATDLAGALIEVSRKLPQLANSCFDNGHLRDGYLANINGTTFTADPATPLESGDCVLILSADAGG